MRTSQHLSTADKHAADRVRKRLARLAPSAGAVAEPGARAAVVGADLVGLERLVGGSQLMGAEFLTRGVAVGRSVARVVVGTQRGLVDTYGTGVLVSPRLLMTNHHVLAAATAARSWAEFDYQLDADGRAQTPLGFGFAPAALLVTDPTLDYTLVAVADQTADGRQLSEFGYSRLIEAEGKVILHELLNIVQHPNGGLKQLALRENRLVDLAGDFLHYETDTAPGSSGAPVFNDRWELVGLHHSGVPRRDPSGRILTATGQLWAEAMGEDAIAWVANEGARVSRIVAHLRSRRWPTARPPCASRCWPPRRRPSCLPPRRRRRRRALRPLPLRGR